MGNGNQDYHMARQGTTLTLGKSKRPTKRETNDEFVNRLMNFSQSGAMMQLFILDALSKQADAVANMPFEEFEKKFGPNSLFSPLAWHQTAKELQAELKERLK
jgi:hypothetical protein